MEYVVEDLLVGDLKILQSDSLYRFTSDAVLLSRFPKIHHENVLDLCAGSGIVGLHYYGTMGAKSITFVEVQNELATMCSKSIELNGLEQICKVENVNLKDFNGQNKFDCVFCNPPYKKQNSGYKPVNPHIAICRQEILCTLEDIILCAKRALKQGGHLYMCQRTERLVDTITMLRQNRIEPCNLTFVKGKNSSEPYLFLIDGVFNKILPLKIATIENNATDFKG